jgi:hypothetical protein
MTLTMDGGDGDEESLYIDFEWQGGTRNGNGDMYWEQPHTGIVGSWGTGYDSTTENVLNLTFYGNGTYVHWETDNDPADSRDASGVEYGTYSFDPATGTLEATSISKDENGWSGLSDTLSGACSFSAVVAGDTMTINDSCDSEPYGFSRVVDTNPIVGSWGPGYDPTNGEVLELTFYPNGSYVHYQKNDVPEDSGVEYGTYNYDPSTHVFSATAAVNENSQSGLSDPGTGFGIEVTGDVMTITENGEVFNLYRVGVSVAATEESYSE